jgi:anthranilate phosphoribosyltransferase
LLHVIYLGVYKPKLLDDVSYVAKKIGYTNAMFVHGLDGLDEISLLGKTRINQLKNGNIKSFEISPELFELTRRTLEDIKTGSPQVNAQTIIGVFDGSIKGPHKDAILLNASGALMVGGKATDFKEGIKLARKIIDSGKALKKLNELK